MRVLLDECVDEDLRHLLKGHEVQTVRYAQMAGLKNGALLQAAEAAGFEVIVTTDQGIAHQQNFHERKISVIILAGRTNRLIDLKGLVPSVLRYLTGIAPGQVITVGD